MDSHMGGGVKTFDVFFCVSSVTLCITVCLTALQSRCWNTEAILVLLDRRFVVVHLRSTVSTKCRS